MPTNEPRRCSGCQSALTTGLAAEGLCPRCLLLLALEADPRDDTKPPARPAVSVSRRILTLLGRGPHASVYLAEQRGSPRLVALKVFDRAVTGAEAPEVAALMDRLLSLAHPAVVPIVDAGLTEDRHPYLVSEFQRGVSLAGYCRRVRPSSGAVWSSLARVADALQYAHDAGVAHGHLVGENIRATADAPLSVKVCDFGSATLAGAVPTIAADLTALSTLARDLAAPASAAMEALLSSGETAQAADVARALRRLAGSGKLPT